MSPRSNYNGYAASRPAVMGLAKVLVLALGQLSFASAAPLKQFFGIAEEDLTKEPEDASLWLYLTIAVVLVLLGGAFAGLTIA